jgi:hypothetical protein
MTRMMEQYQPTEGDIKLAASLVSIMNDGGQWAIPETQQIYRFDHSKKVMELQNPDTLTDPAAMELHFRQAAVFSEVGYSVTEKGAHFA